LYRNLLWGWFVLTPRGKALKIAREKRRQKRA
jgi:hypothetical protein